MVPNPKSRQYGYAYTVDAWIPWLGSVFSFARNPVDFFRKNLAAHNQCFRFKLAGLSITLFHAPLAHAPFFTSEEKILSFREAYVNMFEDVVGPDAFAVSVPIKSLFIGGMHQNKYNGFADLIVREIEEYYDGWSRELDQQQHQNSASTSQQEVRMSIPLFNAMNELVLFTTSRCLAGREIRETDGLIDLLHDLEGGFNALGLFLPQVPFPSVRKRRTARNAILSAFNNIVRRRKETLHEGDDVLSALLEARDSEGNPLPDAQLAGLLLSFIFVGQVQTYSAAAWTLLHLADPRNASHLDEVLREIQNVSSDHLDFSSLWSMEHLKRCVKETIRLTAPVMMLRMVSSSDLDIPGHSKRVAKNELLAISPYLIHHDPNIYVDPDMWRPERWMPCDDSSASLVRAPPNAYVFVGFGRGRHACMGEQFAYMEIVAMIAILLRRFRIHGDPNGVPDPDFTHIGGLVLPCRPVEFSLSHVERRK